MATPPILSWVIAQGADSIGILDEHTVLAHQVNCGPHDVATLARTGAQVVHNPLANTILGSGMPPLMEMLGAGIPVAISTDGSGSADNQNMLAAARLAAQYQKAVRQDATLLPAVPDPATLDDDPEPYRDPPVDAADDALFFGTSGSTASSKLVAQSHGNAVANALAVGRHHRLRPGDRFLGCLPIHHVNGLHFTVLATLVAGTHAVLAHGFEPLGYPELVRRFRPRLEPDSPTRWP